MSAKRDGRQNDPLDEWPEFVSEIRDRLEQGRRDYGDQSFLRNPGELAEEIRQELADVAGWAFILWSRLRRIDWSKVQPCVAIGEKLKVVVEEKHSQRL
jgi:hypothetical protein